jgi:hypothetical protein
MLVEPSVDTDINRRQILYRVTKGGRERHASGERHLGICRAISSRLSDGVSGVLSKRRLGFTVRALW